MCVCVCVLQVREPTGPLKMEELWVPRVAADEVFEGLNVTGTDELADIIDGASPCWAERCCLHYLCQR